MSELGGVIEDLEKFKSVLDRWKGKAHILSPLARTSFDYIAEGFSPSIRVAYISTNPDDHEIYEQWDRKGVFCLSKLGLQRLDQIAGLKWNEVKSDRDPNNNLICTGYAEAEVQDIDGTVRNAMATKTIDLGDQSPEVKGMTPKQIGRARANINSLAETKAKNKVRREILGLNDGFKLEDFKKPFVIIKLVKVRPAKIDDPVLELAVKLSQHNVSLELYMEAQKFLAAGGSPQNQLEEKIDTIVTNLLPSAYVDVEVVKSEPLVPIYPDQKQEPKFPWEALVTSVTQLYQDKGVTRSASKPPLSDLTVEQLTVIERELKLLPDRNIPNANR